MLTLMIEWVQGTQHSKSQIVEHVATKGLNLLSRRSSVCRTFRQRHPPKSKPNHPLPSIHLSRCIPFQHRPRCFVPLLHHQSTYTLTSSSKTVLPIPTPTQGIFVHSLFLAESLSFRHRDPFMRNEFLSMMRYRKLHLRQNFVQ